ncbi:hypothetical protein H9Y04_32825 [Streptomyces sp. TRM66268-LWL]|uniref:Uncharacterized protein n=1 Tax=Streptomyces polyasparticus TaxID=2767826 RepID=A0ABR7SSQ9_9ACTN|nr:hypothetical protein [Streptomyces polyasparticus]MBC9717323.1 hypothetical protein [Streptomyces polyasparticus]
MVPIRRRIFARKKTARAGARADFSGDIHHKLGLDLPEDDLGEDLEDALDLYEMGSKPRCEEAEYLHLLQEARDRIAAGE